MSVLWNTTIQWIHFFSENVQSVFHNTVSKKGDWHNTVYIIKTSHGAKD